VTGQGAEPGLRNFLNAPGSRSRIASSTDVPRFWVSGTREHSSCSVPMVALIQIRARPTHQARSIAANNILSALGMIASAVIAGLLLPGWPRRSPAIPAANGAAPAKFDCYSRLRVGGGVTTP
jgi:hypothetical protein